MEGLSIVSKSREMHACMHARAYTQSFILKTTILESGEMAQVVESPLFKFEDLHSNPQH